MQKRREVEKGSNSEIRVVVVVAVVVVLALVITLRSVGRPHVQVQRTIQFGTQTGGGSVASRRQEMAKMYNEAAGRQAPGSHAQPSPAGP
jgi:hypothetical protein